MEKDKRSPEDTLRNYVNAARPRRLAPSVRVPQPSATARKTDESAARRSHRQHMKAYFGGEKSAG